MKMATTTSTGALLARVGFALAVAVHLVVLYLPAIPSSVPAGIPGADKVVHVLVFAAVMATGVIARVPTRWLVAALVVHASLSEVIQEMVLPGRGGELADLAANLGGIALGWYLASVVRRRRLEVPPEEPAVRED